MKQKTRFFYYTAFDETNIFSSSLNEQKHEQSITLTIIEGVYNYIMGPFTINQSIWLLQGFVIIQCTLV